MEWILLKLKIGDKIIGIESHNKGIVRKITEVRETGYTWEYPDSQSSNDYISENSSDPFFEFGWIKYPN